MMVPEYGISFTMIMHKVDDYYDFKRLLKNEIADCNCNTCMFCMIKHL